VGLAEEFTMQQFEQEFTEGAKTFGFASLVRCSLTGWNAKTEQYSAESRFVTEALKTNSAGYGFVRECVTQHLKPLPPVTKKVVLLGNTPSYVKSAQRAIGAARGEVHWLNEVAYSSGEVVFAHVTHPSRLNGHFGAFVRGEGSTGLKRDQAKEALGGPLRHDRTIGLAHNL
jgi:hypothetical protein